MAMRKWHARSAWRISSTAVGFKLGALQHDGQTAFADVCSHVVNPTLSWSYCESRVIDGRDVQWPAAIGLIEAIVGTCCHLANDVEYIDRGRSSAR